MPPNLLPLLILLLLSFLTPFSTSTPYSSIAISHTKNSTLVCALIPSSDTFSLNCTSLQSSKQKNYPSGSTYYSAIAAGNGFLCALSLTSNVSTMRWWEFKNTSAATNNASSSGWGSEPREKDSKRVYSGTPILALSAGDTHVCAIQNGTLRNPYCWRWRDLDFPQNLNLSAIAVGRNFVCVLSTGAAGNVTCFGNDTEVVNGVPSGNFAKIAAGSFHACGVSEDGQLSCWGAGAPVIDGDVSDILSLALGENRTCVLLANWTVKCWGEDWELPESLSSSLFVALEAKGSTVCGVLYADFSLICWGSGKLNATRVVYDRVLPGSCVPNTTCYCGYLTGSGGLCGDDGVICQPCAIKTLNTTSLSNTVSTNSSSSRKRLILIVLGSIGAGIGIIAAVCFLLIHFGLFNRKRVSDSGGQGPNILTLGAPNRRPRPGHQEEMFSTFVEKFSLSVVAGVTGNFSESYKIGSGSFGSVYRATLEDGRVVAVKRACTATVASTSNSSTAVAKRLRDKETAFMSELALLSRINHKNLVNLIGYCCEGPERILLYEFMVNGSLYDHLHKLGDKHLGSWGARLRVALDAARGIEYLHVYAVPPIIHRDIKSANILLDDMWTAKVSDFGLSLMSRTEEGNDTDRSGLIRYAAGTVGYMDPEGYRLQNLTAKSDVYSFGVVLLELLTGCKAIHRYEESGTPRNVVEFAVPHIIVDNVYRILDPNLPSPMPGEIEAVTYVSYLAADCVSPEGRDRPTMSEVVSGLERAISAYSVTRVESLQRSTTIRSI